jgi:hypothetical protein
VQVYATVSPDDRQQMHSDCRDEEIEVQIQESGDPESLMQERPLS